MQGPLRKLLYRYGDGRFDVLLFVSARTKVTGKRRFRLGGGRIPAGVLKTRIGPLGGKKSPCGSAKDENRSFGGEKSPCGSAKDENRSFLKRKTPREGAYKTCIRFSEGQKRPARVLTRHV